MRYLITNPSQDTPEAQEAIALMRRHAGRMVLEAVTVGPPYRAGHAVHTALRVPDHLDAQARRMLTITMGAAEGQIALSRPIASRKEWTEAALLLPSPDSMALDGMTLSGWTSARLTVWYLPSRMGALLHCCAEDAGRIADLATAGYTIRRKPSYWTQLREWLRPPRWTSQPLLTPVPLMTEMPQKRPVDESPVSVVAVAPDDAALAGWLRGAMAVGAAVSVPGADGGETEAAHG
jgi:hypothetical protein